MIDKPFFLFSLSIFFSLNKDMENKGLYLEKLGMLLIPVAE